MPLSESVDLEIARLRTELEPALARLWPEVYRDLRQLARAQRRRIAPMTTMSTTALVNELYLKFAQGSGIGVDSRRHFFALCAQAMRQILVDHARRRVLAPVRIDGEIELAEIDGERLIEVDDALRRLEQVQPRQAQVVVCRWFAGYSEVETAEILGITDRTVRRDWDKARAWLGVAFGDAT